MKPQQRIIRLEKFQEKNTEMLSKCTVAHVLHTLTQQHSSPHTPANLARYKVQGNPARLVQNFCRWEKFGPLCWINIISLVYQNRTNFSTISVSKSVKGENTTKLFQNSAPFRTILRISGPNVAAHFFTRLLMSYLAEHSASRQHWPSWGFATLKRTYCNSILYISEHKIKLLFCMSQVYVKHDVNICSRPKIPGSYFNATVERTVFAPRGGNAAIECAVGNLGDSTVRQYILLREKTAVCLT
jgi:hypothetical protein